MDRRRFSRGTDTCPVLGADIHPLVWHQLPTSGHQHQNGSSALLAMRVVHEDIGTDGGDPLVSRSQR